MHKGTKVAEKEFVVLTELLMMQLLKLDSIEAEGEAKVQRRIEVTWHPFNSLCIVNLLLDLPRDFHY